MYARRQSVSCARAGRLCWCAAASSSVCSGCATQQIRFRLPPASHDDGHCSNGAASPRRDRDRCDSGELIADRSCSASCRSCRLLLSALFSEFSLFFVVRRSPLTAVYALPGRRKHAEQWERHCRKSLATKKCECSCWASITPVGSQILLAIFSRHRCRAH